MDHTPPHHHVILWVGVAAFAVLIGAFWVMGLPDMFKNAPAKTSFAETENAWGRVRKQADDMIALMTKQNAETAARETQTRETLKGQLKALLSTTTVAAPIATSTTETTVTTTPAE